MGITYEFDEVPLVTMDLPEMPVDATVTYMGNEDGKVFTNEDGVILTWE